MIKKKPHAVILGLGVNGLGIARSLAMKNVPLYGLYNKKTDIGRFSRYLKDIKAYDVKNEPENLLEQLMRLGKKLDSSAFLIPESDANVAFISENRKELKKQFKFNIPDRNLMDKILTKNGNLELAVEHDILIPKTIYINNKSDIDVVLKEFKLPIILKPLNTFSAKFPDDKKNIVIDNIDSLIRLINESDNLFGNCVIQELIVGLDGNIVICSVYYSKDSEPLAVYTGRKIRQYKPDYGVTCFGISEYIPEIEKISLNFLKKMSYRGLATLEFARDIKNGKYYFLEINGRSYYHNKLFTDCNVNLSYIAYCDAVSFEIKDIVTRQKEGLIWIDFSRDLSSFLRKHKEKKLGLVEWLCSIFNARSYAVFHKSDLLPFMYSFFLLLSRICGSAYKRLKNFFKIN